MTATMPPWHELLVALLVVFGALAALVGSVGLLRFEDLFQRVHVPAVGATLGTWTLALATALQASFESGQPFVHALLVAVFIAVTSPVTTIFLMRAALFRRAATLKDPALSVDQPPDRPPPSAGRVARPGDGS